MKTRAPLRLILNPPVQAIYHDGGQTEIIVLYLFWVGEEGENPFAPFHMFEFLLVLPLHCCYFSYLLPESLHEC